MEDNVKGEVMVSDLSVGREKIHVKLSPTSSMVLVSDSGEIEMKSLDLSFSPQELKSILEDLQDAYRRWDGMYG